ncbi:SDR family NAD(P)-dependent oxidoreductase [Salinarimonas sp.]|uniref:SDR family NAD(P)-dependent oxidoreductase n=1 Tax=Salinarimonas sp. TaxID=2766526 RepID=UPI0032D96C11
MSPPALAVLAAACRFPDAPDPQALWRNVLDGRRSFRPLPPERLDLDLYAPERVGAADSITRVQAGLIEGWEFDRSRFRVPRAAFEATDATHWLALEVAADAFEAADRAAGFDRGRIGVVVANTLAGEFSRAGLLRLREPFLDALLARAAEEEGLDPQAAERLRGRMRAAIRARFPTPDEDLLSGGLANTIAGRIANHLDLHGGAFTVDGACASSLLALSTAADLVAAGRIDAALVGAVDLSLDPFELVGFSRNGALAADVMRVFDARASGFWPGEGAGFVMLSRLGDARDRGLPLRGSIRGWGVSTDGAGGLTRPSPDGQLRALERALAAAGVGPAALGYVEAHGTGTAVGDRVEIEALSRLRAGCAAPLPIGSIKANIGHCKAAAGFAGLIKTLLALEEGVIPPHVSVEEPHPAFAELGDRVAPARARSWPEEQPRVAGVSSFGFGGVNAHVVLAAPPAPRRGAAPLAPVPQADRELFLFAAADAPALADALSAFAPRARLLSMAELADAAAALAERLGAGPWRAAVVAGDGETLASRLTLAAEAARAGTGLSAPERGVCVGLAEAPPRVGFLFSGQAAPARADGGAWARRFPDLVDLLARLPSGAARAEDTASAQPAIAAASLAALRILERVGIAGRLAIGHSLGELAALVFAGALPEGDLVPLARARGRAMADHAPEGAMLRLSTGRAELDALLAGTGAVLACANGRAEQVAAGAPEAIASLERRAAAAGFESLRLPVTRAFHSPEMAGARGPLARALAQVGFAPARRRVVSPTIAAAIAPDADLRALLASQLDRPVRFVEALDVAAGEVDVLVELGPGRALARLAGAHGTRALATDAFGPSLAPLLGTLAQLFVLGVALRPAALFSDRRLRPFDLDHAPRFLASPCRLEAPPARAPAPPPAAAPLPVASAPTPADRGDGGDPGDALSAVRRAAAEATGLPAQTLDPSWRFLDDLHLNSLAVARLVAQSAREAGTRPLRAPTDFANASLAELAAALSEIGALDAEEAPETRVAGVRPWIAPYAMRWADRGPAADAPPSRMRLLGAPVANPDEPVRRGLVADAPEGETALLWLPDAAPADAALVAAVQAARRDPSIDALTICHAGLPLGAFARSIVAEGGGASLRLVDRARGAPDAALRAALARPFRVFDELRVTADGRLETPVFAPATPALAQVAPLGPGDVMLVTGGAGGVGAEAALRLAERSGARLVLAGRSPADDPRVAATLARAVERGVCARYARADVADAPALSAALAEATRGWGPVTALLHAAGVNTPTRFADLAPETVAETLRPKRDGLAGAMAAAGPSLSRVVAFGSIIGRIGLEGEAHYALANAVMAQAVESAAPGLAQALTLEWSVWSGPGMGAQLGTIERLAQRGVDALSLDDALAAIEDALIDRPATGTIAVTSRFGPPPHLDLGAGALPLQRFLDAPRVHFPGVELVVDTTLDIARDRALDDHVVEGVRILPGVLALEAMAQAACALAGGGAVVAVEDLRFARAVAVEPRAGAGLRIAALREPDGRVAVVVRAEDDGYASDRMSARLTLAPALRDADAPRVAPAGPPAIAADGLYGPLFFHGPLFQRIAGYAHVAPDAADFALREAGDTRWFGAYESEDLVLGDPGARDAALHGVQATLLHHRLIPVGVARIERFAGGAPIRVLARRRAAAPPLHTFDVTLLDETGACVERWSGLVLRAVADLDPAAILSCAPGLAPVHLAQAIAHVAPGAGARVALGLGTACDRAARRAGVLADLGLAGAVSRRADGRPILHPGDGRCLTLAHLTRATLAIVADAPVGCDLVALAELACGSAPLHPSLVGAEAADPASAARRFAVHEALRKLGRPDRGPVSTQATPLAGVRTADAGGLRIALVDLALPSGPAIAAIAFAETPTVAPRPRAPEEISDAAHARA